LNFFVVVVIKKEFGRVGNIGASAIRGWRIEISLPGVR